MWLSVSLSLSVNETKTCKIPYCERVLVVNELFNIVPNDFDAKKSACCKRLLVVTELVVSSIPWCHLFGKGILHNRKEQQG